MNPDGAKNLSNLITWHQKRKQVTRSAEGAREPGPRPGEPAEPAESGSESEPDEDDLQKLEELAWKGPRRVA